MRLGGLIIIVQLCIIICGLYDGVLFDTKNLQHYAGNNTTDHIDDKESGIATIDFFLTCLLLLVGRFTSKQFDTAMTEHRMHITRVVASQVGELVNHLHPYDHKHEMTWFIV